MSPAAHSTAIAGFSPQGSVINSGMHIGCQGSARKPNCYPVGHCRMPCRVKEKHWPWRTGGDCPLARASAFGTPPLP